MIGIKADEARERATQTGKTKREKYESMSLEELKAELISKMELNIEDAKEHKKFLFRMFEEFRTDDHLDEFFNYKGIELAEKKLEFAREIAETWEKRDFILHFVEGRKRDFDGM